MMHFSFIAHLSIYHIKPANFFFFNLESNMNKELQLYCQTAIFGDFHDTTIVFPFFVRSVSRVSLLSKVLPARAPFTAIRRRKRRQRRLRRRRKKETKCHEERAQRAAVWGQNWFPLRCYDGDAVHEAASTRRRLYARGGMARLKRNHHLI